MLNTVTSRAGRPVDPAPRKVVVVNGGREMLGLLESVLGGGNCDAVFVSDTAHAYSQVRQHHPNLVVLCIDLDDPFGFQVLSMLRLDEETAAIPVLTYTSGLEAAPARRPTETDTEEDEDSLGAPDPPMH